jgi:lipid-binding SYLF domain-containing protein
MKAEILSYSRSRGAFAGISLKGAVLRPDNDANKDLYGRQVDMKELVLQGNISIPEPARKFVESVTQASSGQ